MPHLTCRSAARTYGFTLVELMVTLAVMAILSAVAMPSFSSFMAENRAKSKAANLTAAVQNAQFEAARRNREILFTLTSSIKPTTSLVGDASGRSWASVALPLAGSGSIGPEVIGVGGFTENASDVRMVASSAGICFLPDGSIKANTSTGVTSANCALDATTGTRVRVYPSRGSQVWQVSVSPMGKITSCIGREDVSGTFTCS